MAQRVVVVGAGISGLAAAHALGVALPDDVEVLVLEGSPAIGGKLRAGEVAGLPCDLGAEALLNRRPEAVALARAVGLNDDIEHPATAATAVWTRDAVRVMPRTVMGVPTDLDALARSGIISRTGMARARIEPWLPGAAMDAARADTVSVGDVVDRRFGAEVTDRLVEPLLGGVYAGDARQLSLAAAAPQVARLASGGSLLRAAASTEPAPNGPVFAGIRGGVGRLPAAVAAGSRARIRTGATVRELHHRTEGGWNLVVGSTTDPERISADAVVLATPAPATARLLAEVSPQAEAQLRHIEYAGMAVVTLAYPSAAVGDRLTGSGFLVPKVDGRAVKAATFSANKWQWLGDLGERESVTLLRASIGRHGGEPVLQRDDGELIEMAAGDLEEAVGLRGRLVDAQVTRWGGALPQYAVGHVGRVERIRTAVGAVVGLEVCGAAYDGIGIAACVADGQRAATRIVADLQGRRQ
uniref:Coproporphyrinogen III oxidase n=1 Tax=uncultured Nocardioidaceae bacterium TaxID=253824 RepID=A0A6J4MBT9_9ACTN|nr:MAG: Protoporphyrinogen IX oxidase, aerobic, HemY [uncultured Nocardioidaceae bacterium]